MLVYVWSRRNPYVRMNFFGLLNFQAPFLPWVLMGFSLLLGNSIIVDLLGLNTAVSVSALVSPLLPTGFDFKIGNAQLFRTLTSSKW
ncbi:hypothetical protein NN561_004053 [Cricetulus griseus]